MLVRTSVTLSLLSLSCYLIFNQSSLFNMGSTVFHDIAFCIVNSSRNSKISVLARNSCKIRFSNKGRFPLYLCV